MTYSAQLRDPRWQRRRLEIMQRDDFACTICGAKTQTLHVHHHRYGATPWDVPDDALTTICEWCHEAKHARATVTVLQRDGSDLVISTERARRFAVELLAAVEDAERAAGV